jgi:hypothetical protein
MPHRGETEAERQAQRGAFEERRVQRVEALKQELIRDHLLDPHKLDNVSYYQTIEQQNQFLNSISNTQFGKNLLRLQYRFNVEMGIPLILPRFNNLTNISVNEQQFLAMQGIGIGKDRQGKYGAGIQGSTRAFENIEQTNGKAGAYYQQGGAGYQEVVKQKKPARVFGVTPEPTVVTGQLPFVTKKPPSVFQPKKTLSPQIKKIIDDWSVKKIIVPAWFANNNMNWVLEGRISEQEFLDAYTNLVNIGAITFTTPQVTIAPIPEITIPSIPEVTAQMELITTNFQVKLDNKIQFSSSLSNADYKRLQDEMSLEPKITLVFLNQTDFNPLSNFSKILRQIQNLLRGQVVETITIGPTGQVITAPEPTVVPGKGLMGAGVLGLIGILMLGGFIADHVRKRK